MRVRLGVGDVWRGFRVRISIGCMSLLLVPLIPSAQEAAAASVSTVRNVHRLMSITSDGPNALRVWRSGLDDTEPNNGRVCDVSVMAGLVAPSADVPAVITGPCNFDLADSVIGGLAPTTLYTFAARTRYPDGSISDPYIARAMTRTAGMYLADNDRSSFAWRTAGRAGLVDAESVAYGPRGKAYVVFADRPPSLGPATVYFTTRSPGGAWAAPRSLGASDADVFLTRTAAGRLVAGWTESATPTARAGPAYRVLPAGSATWGPVQRLAPNSFLVGLAQDRSGRLHVLTSVRQGEGDILTYRTNATGRWTSQRLPQASSRSYLSGQIAVDPVTDRVVVAYTDSLPKSTTLRVATASARSRTFTTIYRRLTLLTPANSHSWVNPTGVTSYAGRITVGISRRTVADTAQGSLVGSATGLYVTSGTTASNVGGLTRVGGTTWRDGRAVVVAVSSTRLFIAFTRTSTNWGSDQGLYLVKRVYNATSHRWTFTVPVKRSGSPYDRAVGAGRDLTGHIYLAYLNTWCDFDNCGGP